MSYILKALRKSEQERQALHADGAAEISIKPSQSVSKQRLFSRGRWFILLNIAVVAYLLFKIEFNQPPQVKVTPMIEQPVVADPHETPLKDNTAISVTPLLPNPEQGTAISDLWAEHNTVAQAPPPKAVVTPAPAVVAAIKKVIPKEKPVKAKPILDEAPDTIPRTVDKDKVKPVAPIEQETVLEERPHKTVAIPPLLRELAADYQAKIPALAINVLAYDDNVIERFVIIDMVKYKIGQLIKQKVHLDDIQPDYVLLSAENKVFRLDRP